MAKDEIGKSEIMANNIVTAKEISQYLKLSESTVYKLASAGELPGFKIGDSWRFDMDLIVSMIHTAIETTMKSKDEPSVPPFGEKRMTRVKMGKKRRSEDGE
jgi:excisionase family DNA binding protein